MTSNSGNATAIVRKIVKLLREGDRFGSRQV